MVIVDCRRYSNLTYDAVKHNCLLSSIIRRTAFPPGQYALAGSHGNEWFLARDPLGCNKLFYGWQIGKVGENLVVANRIDDALENGVHLDDLASCPPGALLCMQNGMWMRHSSHNFGGDKKTIGLTDLNSFRSCVQSSLNMAFNALNSLFPSARYVVCMSGGLDSSIIAYYARQYFENLTAVTYSLSSEAGQLSEDMHDATTIARALALPHFKVLQAPDKIIGAIDDFLRTCQDWRDFNVHCAAVNLALGRAISAKWDGEQIVVLTGDLMNEFLCDYSAEIIDGITYYPQPRTSLTHRRRFFVRGLDTSDREIGPFNSYNLINAQPFAAVADHYMRLEPSLLEAPHAKRLINGALLSEDILSLVPMAKNRAQTGGEDGGILALFHRAGINQVHLRERWANTLPPDLRGEDPWDIIHIGGYRTNPRRR